MEFTVNGKRFQISNECWQRSGMRDFVPSGSAYTAISEETEPIIMAPIADISPPERDLGNKLVFYKERMEAVLGAISKIIPLPPIEVEQSECGGYRYKLSHGVHRYYASAAAGFSHVPVVVRQHFDAEAWFTAEGAKCNR